MASSEEASVSRLHPLEVIRHLVESGTTTNTSLVRAFARQLQGGSEAALHNKTVLKAGVCIVTREHGLHENQYMFIMLWENTHP